MNTEVYNNLKPDDFPMIVKYNGALYENKEFIASSIGDFHPYGYAYIQIIQKKTRLKIFGKPVSINEKPKLFCKSILLFPCIRNYFTYI